MIIMQNKKLLKLASIGMLGLALGASVTSAAAPTVASSYVNNSIQFRTQNVSVADTTTPVGDLLNEVSPQISSFNYSDTSCLIEISIKVNGFGESFYVGYGKDAESVISGQLIYTVIRSDGKKEKRVSDITRINKNDFSDNLGDIGSQSIDTDVLVPLNYGEKIDEKGTFYVNNIVRAITNESGLYIPETNSNGDVIFNHAKAKVSSSSKVFEINNFLDIDYLGYSNFGNSTDFSMQVKGVATKEVYISLSSSLKRIYEANVDKIEQGLSWIRVRISFSADTKFNFLMNNGEHIVVPSGAQNVDITNTTKRVGFLINDFDYKNVANISIENFLVMYDIYSSESGKFVPKSNRSKTFYSYDLNLSDIEDSTGTVIKPGNKNNTYKINSTLIMVGIVLGIFLAYGAIATYLYFYLKKKNKDDEFKRMNTKEYIKTNIMGFLTIESVALMVTSIVLRSSLILSTFAVFNSTDVIIIFFSVASIILVGYFIKYYATQFKNIKERKKMDEINSDKRNGLDDGTLIIPKNNK